MRRRVLLLSSVLLAAGHGVAAAPAHQARLSADLQDHLTAGSQSIEIIVHGDRATIDALAARYNVVIKRYLASDGAVLLVTAGQLAAIRDDGSVDHISGNVPIRASDTITSESIGADQVWAGSNGTAGLNGSGVVVAVIDSGIDPTHAALRDRVIATYDFTGGDGVDHFGHGTHVAGIIAGARVATPDGADYQGIAWGARLVNLRVLDGLGAGTVSDVIDAIDWAIANRERYGIRVINLSLGAPVLQPYHDDPLCEAVERAVRAGLVVVAAAGNYGQSADGKTVLGSITSPANDPLAIAVGAIDTHGTADRSDDTIAPYSSRGPTAYDLVLKPDLAAPGQHIVSAEAANAYLPAIYPSHHVTGEGANAYFDLSGTSMAAAVVSGATALVLETSSGVDARQVKAALQLTASFMPQFGLIAAGSGSLNALSAVEVAQGQQLSAIWSPRDDKGALPLRASNGPIVTLRTPSSNDSSSLNPSSIVWGVMGSSIVWGVTGSSIVWGVKNSSIVWGVASSSIVWGITSTSIVWGVANNSSLPVDASSIVWGVQATSIVWGINKAELSDLDPAL